MAAKPQALISQLEAAEAQAETIIATAKRNRQAKLKQAKEKAEEDLATFRKERESQFQKEMSVKATRDPAAELSGTTAAEVEAVKSDYARNKDKTIKYVIEKILDVATTLTDTQTQSLKRGTV